MHVKDSTDSDFVVSTNAIFPRQDDRKMWGDRRGKYDTLSGGSALSKSMKYAETWLYGGNGPPGGGGRSRLETASLFGTVRAPHGRAR